MLCLYEHKKIPIEKAADRCPGGGILFHDISNNIIISHPYSLGKY